MYHSGDTADAVSPDGKGASFLCKVTTATRFNVEDGDRGDNTFHLRAFLRLTFFSIPLGHASPMPFSTMWLPDVKAPWYPHVAMI